MDMTGYLGKKVDLTCKDGERYSGYVFDVLDEEDSDIGCKSIELSPLDVMHVIAIPVDDIESVVEDDRYRTFDFRS